MLKFLPIAFLALFCSFGTFAQKKSRKTKPRPRGQQVVAAVRSRFPLQISKNGRHFVDQFDNPFLMNADAGWMLFQKLRIEEARVYLANRKAKYFNTIFLQLLPAEPNDRNAYGEAPFLKQGDLLPARTGFCLSGFFLGKRAKRAE